MSRSTFSLRPSPVSRLPYAAVPVGVKLKSPLPIGPSKMRDVVGPRRDRAWAIVNDCLAAQLYGASTMMVMDRLVRAGYTLEEAGKVLQDMREAKLVAFESGHWVLQQPTASSSPTGSSASGASPAARSPAAPRPFTSWQ